MKAKLQCVCNCCAGYCSQLPTPTVHAMLLNHCHRKFISTIGQSGLSNYWTITSRFSIPRATLLDVNRCVCQDVDGPLGQSDEWREEMQNDDNWIVVDHPIDYKWRLKIPSDSWEMEKAWALGKSDKRLFNFQMKQLGMGWTPGDVETLYHSDVE